MRRRGYLYADVIVALGLLTGVAVTLLLAKSGTARVNQRLNDSRAAVRVAERYLIDAAAHPATRPAADAKLSVTELPTTAPANWKWVKVDAVVNGGRGEVVGLVRSEP